MSELSPRAARRLRGGPRLPPCLCCGAPLAETFCDLGLTPLAGNPLAPEGAGAETFRPLRALVCSECRLVQLDRPAAPRPGRRAAGPCLEALCDRLGLETGAGVLEIGSGAGERLAPLLRRGLVPIGIEPRAEAAERAEAAGIATEAAAFGPTLARRLRAEGEEPALVCAHGLLADAADPHELLAGLRIMVPPGSVASLTFPHLLPVLRDARFDALRHTRPVCLSLLAAELLLLQHGLVPFDARETPEDGGSLHLLVRHMEDDRRPVGESVEAQRLAEMTAGLHGPDAYRGFAERVVEAKCALLDFLVGLRRAGRRVAGWGAPESAATLLPYCGIGPELLPYTADPDPARQGFLLPGSRIPIHAPAALLRDRPDFVLVLPWQGRDEALRAMPALRAWGGRCALPLPTIEIH